MKKTLRFSFGVALFTMLFPFCTISAQSKLRSFEEDSPNKKVNTDKNFSSSRYFTPGFIPTMSIGYGFVDSDGYTYEATFGVNYEFAQNLYIGARIGYLGGGSHFYDQGMTFDSNMHFISIPLELGYTLVNEQKYGIVPFVGLGFNIGLSGDAEINNYETDLEIGGDLGVDGRAGLRLMLSGWTISGTYHFPLNNNQEGFFGEDAYPELSIGWFMFD